MKNTLFITLLVLTLCCTCGFAQQGEIIYTDFDPDLTLVEGINFNDSIMLDIDYDGVYDVKFFLVFYHFTVPVYEALNGWSLCAATDSTFLDSEYIRWRPSYYLQPYTTYIGLKKDIGEDCYYGWFYTYDGNTKNAKGTKAGTLFIDRVAYCPIPNYPLRAGQTSFDTSIDEPEATAFATIHPNPTTGKIHIEGEKATEIQVFNALGQLVKTVQNTNEVGLEGQPQGLYLLRVTLEGGKVFSDKVVKE